MHLQISCQCTLVYPGVLLGVSSCIQYSVRSYLPALDAQNLTVAAPNSSVMSGLFGGTDSPVWQQGISAIGDPVRPGLAPTPPVVATTGAHGPSGPHKDTAAENAEV